MLLPREAAIRLACLAASRGHHTQADVQVTLLPQRLRMWQGSRQESLWILSCTTVAWRAQCTKGVTAVQGVSFTRTGGTR